jgi:transposase
MFIVKKSTPNSPRKTVQIVESYRVGKSVRHKIIAYIGIILTPEDELKLMALAKQKLLSLIKDKSAKQGRTLTDNEAISLTKRGRKKPELLPPAPITNTCENINLLKIEEEYRVIDGVDDVVGAVFDDIGFNIFKTIKQNQTFKDIILSRMVYSQSKLKLCETMRTKFDKHYNEDQIYRIMDLLYPKIDKVKKIIFNKTHALMPTVNVLLFDVTTLYCESIVQDGLRDFGFSKDGKFNNTQLVLALATNELGLPIGYELFPGNCAEVKTLMISIDKWSKLFNIKDVCFIGDRAMFSEDNINLIEEHGYKYIIAAKLRSLSDELQVKILDEANYQDSAFGEESGRIAEFAYNRDRPSIKCSVNADSHGYAVTKIDNNITSIEYRSPNTCNITATQNALDEAKNILSKLRIYTSRCKCIFMTKEEYELKSKDVLNDIAIITDDAIHYNNQTASLASLTKKQQKQVTSTAQKGKIANSIMLKLFAEHYIYTSYINIPHRVMELLFPDQYKQSHCRLCVSYKPSRATNDAKKRERILTKLRLKQGSANKVLKTPAKMYMLTDGSTKLDDEKIASAEKWDGIHGVATNIMTGTPQEILTRYSGLWRIEEAFRINKHNLKMRPIYHYKKERIYSHIAICYMAFTLLKLIQYQTQLTQPRFTINNIVDTLLSVESSIFIDLDTKIRYKVPGAMSAEAKALYRAFGINKTRKTAQYTKCSA